MTLNAKVLSSEVAIRSIKESTRGLFGPDYVVLIGDTNFFTGLSNRHVWAEYAVQKGKVIAGRAGKKFEIFNPREVTEEYDMLFERSRKDENGIPLAHQRFKALMDNQRGVKIHREDYTSDKLATDVWRANQLARYGATSNKIRSGISLPDKSVIKTALEIASQGTEVYVASADFRDVIGPLRKESTQQELEALGMKIVPLPPCELERQYWEGSNISLETVISDTVVADLQAAKFHPGLHVWVIFEKAVRSGDFAFNVGVAVAEQKKTATFSIPPECECLGKNYLRIPTVQVRSLSDSASQKLIKASFSVQYRSSPFMLVVQQTQPDFPYLFSRGMRGYPPLRAALNFLDHQTTSVYAKTHFVPNSKK